MSESTIIITSADLADHAVLSRKKVETIFRRDYLLRNGSAPTDAHVIALGRVLIEIEEKLKPIEEKLKHIDLITIVPHRAEISRLTGEINQHNRNDLDSAVKTKSGAVYDLMKLRAALTKMNFERRDDIARLTVIANAMPRACGEGVRALVEADSMEEVDVSCLSDDKQQELVNLLGRLSKAAFIYNSKLSLDKKKVDGLTFLSWNGEVRKLLATGQEVWVRKEFADEWDRNEAVFKETSNKIIAKTHEKQVRAFSESEQVEFDQLQRTYITTKEKRMSMMPSLQHGSVEMPRVEQKPVRTEVQQIDL